jgi:hypothetical protein
MSGTYTLVVSNVGMVSETDELSYAQHDFKHYVGLSRRRGYYGRCYGESVTLFENGEPIKEYSPIQKSTKHYHAMNGSFGCMPDNNEIHTSKKSAIESICGLFDNPRGMKSALLRTGIFYFADAAEAGAAYAEVVLCHEADCTEGE